MAKEISIINKHCIGFEHLFKQYPSGSYPPYNVAKLSNNEYFVEIAVAGFAKDALEVLFDNETLIVKSSSTRVESTDIEYLHRGLGLRSFELSFTLAENVTVSYATLEHGILKIFLKRVQQLHSFKKIEIEV